MGLCVCVCMYICVCVCVCVWGVYQLFVHISIMHCYPIMFFKVLYENKGNMFCLMYDLRGLRH